MRYAPATGCQTDDFSLLLSCQTSSDCVRIILTTLEMTHLTVSSKKNKIPNGPLHQWQLELGRALTHSELERKFISGHCTWPAPEPADQLMIASTLRVGQSLATSGEIRVSFNTTRPRYKDRYEGVSKVPTQQMRRVGKAGNDARQQKTDVGEARSLDWPLSGGSVSLHREKSTRASSIAACGMDRLTRIGHARAIIDVERNESKDQLEYILSFWFHAGNQMKAAQFSRNSSCKMFGMIREGLLGFLELTGKSDSGNVGSRFGVGHGSFIRGDMHRCGGLLKWQEINVSNASVQSKPERIKTRIDFLASTFPPGGMTGSSNSSNIRVVHHVWTLKKDTKECGRDGKTGLSSDHPVYAPCPTTWWQGGCGSWKQSEFMVARSAKLRRSCPAGMSVVRQKQQHQSTTACRKADALDLRINSQDLSQLMNCLNSSSPSSLAKGASKKRYRVDSFVAFDCQILQMGCVKTLGLGFRVSLQDSGGRVELDSSFPFSLGWNKRDGLIMKISWIHFEVGDDWMTHYMMESLFFPISSFFILLLYHFLPLKVDIVNSSKPYWCECIVLEFLPVTFFFLLFLVTLLSGPNSYSYLYSSCPHLITTAQPWILNILHLLQINFRHKLVVTHVDVKLNNQPDVLKSLCDHPCNINRVLEEQLPIIGGNTRCDSVTTTLFLMYEPRFSLHL
ncbi:hypothetical protein VP01_1260g1 [Puccinia sorghi]|uniref:Uncharacterized protein n=1 Tax=Puccinia sorghi TaxID=27349 RepID=A0A0L6VP74_9BASI|nr:hypothetical protein VP01_1260g1 [Puccinia sorghi]